MRGLLRLHAEALAPLFSTRHGECTVLYIGWKIAPKDLIDNVLHDMQRPNPSARRIRKCLPLLQARQVGIAASGSNRR